MSASFRPFVRPFRCVLTLARTLALAVAVAAAAGAQTGAPVPPPAPPAAPSAPAPVVEVPAFPNATCPIMGKKASVVLSVDTDLGRFYVCCKPCFKKVLADVPKAHQTAYPVVEERKNTKCPVSGRPIGDKAVAVTLQGYRFAVCCAECVPKAQQHSQTTLVKLTRQDVVDVGNATCPVSGEPVVANAIVLVDGALIHLASHKHADAVKQAPASMLSKARELAKAPAAPAPAKDAADAKAATDAKAKEASK
jgi:hypothetical protein